jgi:DNA adenine methylase
MDAVQQVLFPRPLDSVVNVASVKQLSPFRYPGGKTWLIPRIRQWLSVKRPKYFIEPFAGGGIVSLSVAAENLADKVIMVELDEQVAAVWKCIFTDGDGEWLANRIVNFDMTLENLRNELEIKSSDTKQVAFQTILKNRTYHGGILAAGSGLIKFGENGKGLLSRWYPDTLKKRILAISQLRDKITFIQGDAFKVIEEYINDDSSAFFVDPPYTAAGKKAGRRLYNCFELDHDALFDLMDKASGDFLMTYDDAQGVRDLADSHNFGWKLVAMKNTHHAQMTELLISKNLNWV